MNESLSKDVQVVIRTVNSDEIVVRNSKQLGDKRDEIKTAEYFLDMEHTSAAGNEGEEELVTMEEEDGSEYVSVEIANTQDIVVSDKEVIIWDELCRICANSNEQFIPIFSGEGLQHELQSKIQNYLPLKVSENDTLPHKVCYNCAATLLSWHDLYKNCQSAQQKLIDLQSKLNSSGDEFCNDTTTEDENVQNVLEVETANDDDDDDDYNITLKDEGEDGEIEEENTKVLEVSAESVSNRSASVQIPIIKSLDTKLAKKEPVCGSSVDNNDASTAINHLLSSKLPKFKKKRTAKPKERSESEKKVSKEENICDVCGRLFRFKVSLKRHLRIHKNERPYTCYKCGKQFRDSGGLCRHLRDVHAKIKNHTCDECGQSFASKPTLNDHSRTHTGERPFVCESCGKRFKSKSSLYTHAKTHTGDFPHVCTYCCKKFRRRQQLLVHVPTHTGEKNHECEVCSKRFTVKTELNRHLLVHLDLKPFVCDICGYTCRQKRYLNKHFKLKHSSNTEPLAQ